MNPNLPCSSLPDLPPAASRMQGSIFAAGLLFLLVMVGVSVLAAQASFRYITLQQNQRTSDLAVLAAAAVPQAIDEDDAPSAMARATASQVAALNGVPATDLTLSAETSAAQPDQIAFKTVISQASTAGGRLLTVQSWASPMQAASNACMASTTGAVNIYNNARVDAPDCGLASATWLHVCHKASLVAKSVAVGYSMTAQAPYLCAGADYRPPREAFSYNAKAQNKDPAAGSRAIQGMRAHLDGMASGWPYGTRSPLQPGRGGTGQDIGIPAGQSRSIASGNTIGRLTLSGGSLAVTSGVPDPDCARPTRLKSIQVSGDNTLSFGAGCYVFESAVTLNTGASLQIQTPGADQVALVFLAGLRAAGGEFRSGDATTHFAGGSIDTSAGGRIQFGNGVFGLWGGSLSNGRDSSFQAGNGPFYFAGGSLSNSGTLVLGHGPFQFKGGSMTLHAGSDTQLGVGDLNFYGGTYTASGKRLVIGAGGSPSLGAGRVALLGGTFSLTAGDLITRGVSWGLRGGTVSLLGSGRIEATAPTAVNPQAGDRNLLFAIYGGAFSLYQGSGSSALLSGAVYSPKGTNVSIYQHTQASYPEGGCFNVLTGVLDIYQNASVKMAPCEGIAGTAASGGKPARLWQ